MNRPSGQHISAEAARELERRIRAGERPHRVCADLGVGQRSGRRIARRIEAERASGPAPGAPPAGEGGRAFRLGGSATDRRIVELEAENGRLRRELRTAHTARLDDDAIRTILGRMAAAPEAPPAWLSDPPRVRAGRTPEVPMTIWSDWHVGETVSRSETNGINAFDLAVAEARVRRLVERTVSLCREHGPGRYPGIVVNLLGDFISGGLHPELAKTDAAEAIPAALRVRDLLVWALDRMQAEFGRVFVPCTSGNHGRATAKPEFKRYAYKNFD